MLVYGGDINKPEDVVRTIEPVVTHQVDLAPPEHDPILQGLVGVPRAGTATAAFAGFDLGAFPIVGKTGTAQVDGKADTSVFVAFGPVGNAQYASAAILEESGFGADAAAPLVRHSSRPCRARRRRRSPRSTAPTPHDDARHPAAPASAPTAAGAICRRRGATSIRS